MYIPLVPSCPKCGEQIACVGMPHKQCAGFFPDDPVERTVWNSMAAYPSLYGRSAWGRYRVFDHIFIVLGNGYEWQNGNLVSIDEKDSIAREWLTPARSWETNTWYRNFQNQFKPRELELYNKLIKMGYPEEARLPMTDEQEIGHLAEKWAERSGPPKRFYSMDSYVGYKEIPDDAQPTWIHAAFDCFLMMRHIGDQTMLVNDELQKLGYRFPQYRPWRTRALITTIEPHEARLVLPAFSPEIELSVSSNDLSLFMDSWANSPTPSLHVRANVHAEDADQVRVRMAA